MTARIAPLTPPFTSAVRAALEKWMPPGAGVEPLALFRTLCRHERLSERLRGLGAALLGGGLVPLRARELVILRTCARCGAEYEWGVHATAFAAAAGLDEAAVRATVERVAGEIAAATDDDALVLRLADELHDTATLSPALWELLAARYGEAERIELIAIAGFYHLVAFAVLGLAIEHEPWARRFPKVEATKAAGHAGSCLCGGIRYEIAGELGDFNYCHCRSCRKSSGSAHGANAPVDRARFRFIEGAALLREYESSPGKHRSFCARCGSPIYARLDGAPDVLRIRLGSLDTPLVRQAKAHTFVAEKAEWDAIEGSMPQFPAWAPRDILVQAGTRQPV